MFEGFGGISSCVGYAFYIEQLTEAPITKRHRIKFFNSSELQELSQILLEDTIQRHHDHLLPHSHPYIERIKSVAQKLVLSNENILELQGKYWTITVIDVPKQNAFVLPTGHIVMFAGMMESFENDDQLAAVLAHEISHAILEHGAEINSRDSIMDGLMLLPVAFIYAIMPSIVGAAFFHLLVNKAIDLAHTKPYSRKTEEEADVVGLFLMASACFDVREASAYWGKRSMREGTKTPSWLSTHPSFTKRQEILDGLMHYAIDTRNIHKCSALEKTDPRHSSCKLQLEGIPKAEQRSDTTEQESSQYREIIKRFTEKN